MPRAVELSAAFANYLISLPSGHVLLLPPVLLLTNRRDALKHRVLAHLYCEPALMYKVRILKYRAPTEWRRPGRVLVGSGS